MPGGARFEPKWDGFRALVTCGERVRIWSRQGNDLSASFPELVSAAAEQLPSGAVFDGEIVAWADGRLDFDVLQRRLNVTAARGRALSRQAPANLVLFDVLAHGGEDVRALSFDCRRELLEDVCGQLRPPLSLSPVTEDPHVAAEWFTDLVHVGVEGLVVKGGAQPYRPAQRDWVKVKHRETVDVIVAAVIGSRVAPSACVVGLVEGGRLRIAGRTTPLKRDQSKELGAILREPRGPHPWPSEVTLGRFSRDRSPVAITLVEPVVAEVSADTARTGGVFRHLVRFGRVRSDLPVPDFDRGSHA